MPTAAERLGRRLVAFDLETTGVDAFTDVPVSFGFVEPAAQVRTGGFVNPGRPIPAGATKIHGISDADVADAMPLGQAADYLATRLSDVWRDGGAVVGMNVAYDLTMVDAVCRQLGLPNLRERGPIGAVYDVLIIDRHLDRYRKGSRKLSDLCALYGVSLEAAHAAVDDAEASLFVFDALVAKYQKEITAIAYDDVTSTLGEWHRVRLQSYSDWRVSKGDSPIAPGEFAWPLYEPS